MAYTLHIDVFPTGGLFELEERTTFSVLDDDGKVVLQVKGTAEASYKGPGWVGEGGHGVMAVQIEGSVAIVTYFDDRPDERVDLDASS